MSVKISEGSIVVAIKDQVFCNLDGEAVILNFQSGDYFGLDPVGARVWSLIQEPKKVKEVRDTHLKEYDVEPSVCERDLMALLQEMVAGELIEIKNETGE